MSKLFKVVEAIEAALPTQLIDQHDNSGLLVGEWSQEIQHIRVALEATNEVIDSAVEDGVDLLLVHHPMIFSPMGQVTSGTLEGKKVIKLIKNKIALYAAHSNFDRVENGLNQSFGQLVGLSDIQVADIESGGYVLKGLLEKDMTLSDYIRFIKEKLALEHIRFVGNESDSIRCVGFCTGSGMSFVNSALFEEVDVYLTGDLKYHDAMWLHETNHKVVDVTHFGSEVMASHVLYGLIKGLIGDAITLSKDTAIIDPIKFA